MELRQCPIFVIRPWGFSRSQHMLLFSSSHEAIASCPSLGSGHATRVCFHINPESHGHRSRPQSWQKEPGLSCFLQCPGSWSARGVAGHGHGEEGAADSHSSVPCSLLANLPHESLEPVAHDHTRPRVTENQTKSRDAAVQSGPGFPACSTKDQMPWRLASQTGRAWGLLLMQTVGIFRKVPQEKNNHPFTYIDSPGLSERTCEVSPGLSADENTGSQRDESDSARSPTTCI